MKKDNLSKKLTDSWRIRCRDWGMCGHKECNHYEAHRSDLYQCIDFNPVKYCSRIRAFTHDVPFDEVMDDDCPCDPNLAFKAIREAGEQGGNPGPDSSYEEYKKWQAEREGHDY